MRISDWSSDVCSSDLMEMAVQVRNQIETGIREGMPRGEFVPHFEPQVDIASGRLIGFEMLMRWESPEYGLIPPERFIPVAEESGLIGELSLQVIREEIGRASCRERLCQYVSIPVVRV